MKCWLALLATLFAIAGHSQVSAQALERPQYDAQDPLDPALVRDAKAAFEQGREAFASGNYDEALERFEHAYTLSGRAELLFDVGIAADRLREDERALAAFERYLREAGDGERRTEVEQRVAALRAARSRARWQSGQREQEPRADDAARDAQSTRPEAVAAAQEPPASPGYFSSRPGTDSDAPSDSDSVLETWWFWAGAAVLVGGGAVAVYALTRPEDRAELPAPNTGVTVATLRLGP